MRPPRFHNRRVNVRLRRLNRRLDMRMSGTTCACAPTLTINAIPAAINPIRSFLLSSPSP